MMLTYRTIAERAYAIKTISGLLRGGADDNDASIVETAKKIKGNKTGGFLGKASVFAVWESAVRQLYRGCFLLIHQIHNNILGIISIFLTEYINAANVLGIFFYFDFEGNIWLVMDMNMRKINISVN